MSASATQGGHYDEITSFSFVSRLTRITIRTGLNNLPALYLSINIIQVTVLCDVYKRFNMFLFLLKSFRSMID